MSSLCDFGTDCDDCGVRIFCTSCPEQCQALALTDPENACMESMWNDGTCDAVSGRCVWAAGYSGCDCPLDCSCCGECNMTSLTCACDLQYAGSERRGCRNGCSGRGTCDALTGLCACASDWAGAAGKPPATAAGAACSASADEAASYRIECLPSWGGAACARRIAQSSFVIPIMPEADSV